jgi:hypothetical protein
MKLTENTLTVLKNFSTINSGIVLRKGKIQKTISPEQTILVEAHLEDDIPEDFGIYDLNQFLGNVTTLKNPEMEFSDKSVVMDDGETQLNYYSCSPSVIISPPQNKDLVLTSVDVKFTLSNATLSKLIKLALMNNLSHLTVIGKNGELRLQTHEKSNDTSNFASTKIDDYVGKDFSVSFKTENLRLIPATYDVEIAIGSFAKFVSESGKLTYFIALETK